MGMASQDAALAMIQLANSAGGSGSSTNWLGMIASAAMSAMGGAGAGAGEAATSGSMAIPGQNYYAAMGGVMTKDGMIPLSKYARGGVAKSPQVAIFGEAGPEAYVPLPDGRSIPVTMTGGNTKNEKTETQNISISVVVNNNDKGKSEDKQTAGGDERSAWTQMADRIKMMVQEEMVTQQRPGGLLYR
jgi:phage-related minor tail protein